MGGANFVVIFMVIELESCEVTKYHSLFHYGSV